MRRSKLLWGLALLNAILVSVLMWKIGGENVASAQARGRGEYIMIPADIPQAPNGVMFVLDTREGVLGAFYYDQNQKQLNVAQPIQVSRLFSGPAGVNR